MKQPINAIHAARVRPLASYQQVMADAAASCTAGWPDPDSWEGEALAEGKWINHDPNLWPRRDAADGQPVKTTQQEIIQLVQQELLSLIRPVQLIKVDANSRTGAVVGQFKSNGMVFRFEIADGIVRYAPLRQGGTRDDSEAEEVEARLDGKPRNCTTGYSCGRTCISKGKVCRATGGDGAKKLAAAVKSNAGPSTRARAAERKIARAEEDLAIAKAELSSLKGVRGAEAARKRREARILKEVAEFDLVEAEADLQRRRRDTADWSPARLAGYREVMDRAAANSFVCVSAPGSSTCWSTADE